MVQQSVCVCGRMKIELGKIKVEVTSESEGGLNTTLRRRPSINTGGREEVGCGEGGRVN